MLLHAGSSRPHCAPSVKTSTQTVVKTAALFLSLPASLGHLQNISNLVWAYGRLSYPHPELFSALAAAAKAAALDGFNDQNLTDLAWGCAATDFKVGGAAAFFDTGGACYAVMPVGAGPLCEQRMVGSCPRHAG